MQTKLLFGLALLTVLVAVPSANAAILDPLNERPVPITIPSGDGDGTDMQTILDTTFMCSGCVNASTGQSPFGMWAFSAFPFGSIPAIAFEYAGNAGSNAFGMWSDTNGDTDSAGRTLVQIFGGASQPGDTAGITYDPGTGLLTVTPVINIGGGIIGGSFAGIDPFSFGFYLQRGELTFYTLDQLNGGAAESVAYNKPGSDTWAIAFEDLPLANADRDYNDLVVKIESLEGAVPEPVTMLLVGTGLLMLGGMRRKFFRR